MQMPTFAADSLYKFISYLGLAASIYGFVYPFVLQKALDSKQAELRAAYQEAELRLASLLTIEPDQGGWSLDMFPRNEQGKQVKFNEYTLVMRDELRKTLTQFSQKRWMSSSQVSLLAHDPEWRATAQDFFGWNDEQFEEKRDSQIEEISRLYRENVIERSFVAARMLNAMNDYWKELDYVQSVKPLCEVWVYAGLGMFCFGVFLWWYKHQRHQDSILRCEAREAVRNDSNANAALQNKATGQSTANAAAP